MPNIQSAKKRVKVSEKKNLQNRIVKSGMRTSIRKFDAAVAAKNAANRKKARLAKQLTKAAN